MHVLSILDGVHELHGFGKVVIGETVGVRGHGNELSGQRNRFMDRIVILIVVPIILVVICETDEIRGHGS